MRNADSSGDVLLRTIGVVLDVVPDCSNEEGGLLADEADLFSEGVDVEGFDVLAVYEDLPILRLVEAHEQLSYC